MILGKKNILFAILTYTPSTSNTTSRWCNFIIFTSNTEELSLFWLIETNRTLPAFFCYCIVILAWKTISWNRKTILSIVILCKIYFGLRFSDYRCHGWDCALALQDILGQVWYLMVLIPDPCCLSYVDNGWRSILRAITKTPCYNLFIIHSSWPF